MAARTRYLSAYYAGGYPPTGEGTCTDLVWRALRAAGYDLKSLVDADIRAHTAEYPRVGCLIHSHGPRAREDDALLL